MKSLILSLFLALPPQAPVPPPPQAPVLPWGSDWGAATAERARTGKPLLVDFRTEGCLPCAAMERVVRDEDVQEALRRFVLLKLDGEGAAGKALRDGFARAAPPLVVDGYPTFVVVAPDARGSSAVSVRGEVPPAAFLKAVLDAERWALSTAIFAGPKAKPAAVHTHRCPADGTPITHTDASFGSAAAHTCPACGRVVWGNVVSRGWQSAPVRAPPRAMPPKAGST